MTKDHSKEYKIDLLRHWINRAFSDFDGHWSRKNTEDLDLNINDISSILQQWEILGYIKLLNDTKYLCKILKEIPDDWENLIK